MQTISRAEFEKKVESEMCYLEYQENMSKKEAREKSIKIVSEKYQVG